MVSEHEKAEQAAKELSSHRDHIIVRPLPKFVLMYPTFIVALLAGTLIDMNMADPRLWTLIFLFTYFINSLILTFDFDRITSIAIALFVVVVLLLVRQFHLSLPLARLLNAWEPSASASFFFGIAVMMAVIFVWILIDTRFDYWEISPNELLHHHGFLGDVERFPAPNMSIKKEIHDVFEFLLLGSGRLVFYPSGKDRPVVLENVVRINAVEERIKRTLDTMRVTIDQGHA